MVRKTGSRIQGSRFRMGRSSLVLALLTLFLCSTLATHRSLLSFAQQPQAQQGQPLYAANAKYVNGVAPGYWPTQGTGLTLNLSAGSSICANAPVSYAGGTLTMAASATNYVFLDMTNSCAPAFVSGGSGFPATGIPIAVVTTSSSAITAVSDARTWFAARPVVDPGGQTYNVKAFGAKGNGTTDDTTAIEAAISAAGTGGTILFPPASYLVSSQIALTLSYQTVYGYGATLKCNQTTATDCLLIGSLSNSSAVDGVMIYGLRLAPGPNSSANSAFRDNAQHTKLVDIAGAGQYSGTAWYTFAHFVENDNDQAETIDHVYDMKPGGANLIICNSTFCGSALWAPGPFSTYAGITWIQDSDLSMQCSGNSIDWESGNTLTISRSIIQSFSQWGVKAVNSNITTDGQTYFERGSCVNPLNDGNGHALAGAGMLLLNSSATVNGAPPSAGGTTLFTTNSPGSTNYGYYIISWNSSGGSHSSPLIIGYLYNGPATVSSSAYINTVWPALPSASKYDLLRVTNPTVQAPYGTGNYAVATGLLPASVCSNGVCSFQDTVTSPASYTIQSGFNLYFPGATFWPGDVVLFPTSDGTSGAAIGTYQGPGLNGGVLVNSAGWDYLYPHVAYTPATGLNFSGNLFPAQSGVIHAPNTADNLTSIPPAMLLPKLRSYVSRQVKGVLNFGTQNLNEGPVDDLTIVDSNYYKTISTENFRPSWDAADGAISEDSTTGMGLANRAATSWSTYINKLPDGMSWASRTYSTGIADQVPHYGVQTTGVGTPTHTSVSDVTSATGWAASTYYATQSIIYDGAHFEMAQWTGTSGASAPTWATTAGGITVDGSVTWVCLGSSSLAANTTYYIKVASVTLTGASSPTSEMSVTTANDSNHHLVLVTENASYPTIGATSYQAGCSTTSGSEAPISPPYTGAYNTGMSAYLPVMNCSGSGSFNSSDTTGYASFPGMFVGGGTAINEMNLYSTASITPSAVSGASCSDQTFTVTGLLATDRVSNITPPSALGNVSLNGYASAASTILLHFCNPSSSSVTPPAGVYSFLAAH